MGDPNLSFTPPATDNYVFVFDALDQRKVTVQPAQQKITTKVKVHYQPRAGDTKDWNLWIWPDGMGGQVKNFTGTDEFGKVADLELDGDYNKVGFIVRTDNWADKDGGDRFINDIWYGHNEVWIKQETIRFTQVILTEQHLRKHLILLRSNSIITVMI
ncbi:pullulanase-associated domain-containing protein [Neobacillus sp. PS3-34]|uniref:pullulanase-associated domain-containing protein n=1 Tax=Neobacillus sp. PS3-34 TaxID=3070678 RepID=UPI0027DFFA83|nr:pullulanase-associated domain-containing protein [Neobacillus sp. PS3-34]WML50653.1 pullulanase-associated domain-containing protein [Neobacillus sp. PS3-34]